MDKEDVDNIFEDFENKVEPKKSTPKIKTKKDEKSLLKEKYEKQKLALEGKYEEEIGALEDKKNKEKNKHGNISNNKSNNIERIAFIAIIVVLIVYIAIDFSFYHNEKDDNIDIQQEINDNETDLDSEDINESESGDIENENEVPPEEEPPEEDEPQLSGEVTFSIINIDTSVSQDVDDLGYLNNIKFIIDNGKDTALIPVVEVFAYDSENKDIYETKLRGTYTFKLGINPGKSHTGIIDLTPKTWKNLDLKKNIRLILNATEVGYITAINREITIS